MSDRPLSDHARDELARIAHRPVPASQVNHGVSDKLMKMGVIEPVQLPSPFKTHKGKDVGHWQLTWRGAELLGVLPLMVQIHRSAFERWRSECRSHFMVRTEP